MSGLRPPRNACSLVINDLLFSAGKARERKMPPHPTSPLAHRREDSRTSLMSPLDRFHFIQMSFLRQCVLRPQLFITHINLDIFQYLPKCTSWQYMWFD